MERVKRSKLNRQAELDDLVNHRLPRTPQEAANMQIRLLQEILRLLLWLDEA